MTFCKQYSEGWKSSKSFCWHTPQLPPPRLYQRTVSVICQVGPLEPHEDDIINFIGPDETFMNNMTKIGYVSSSGFYKNCKVSVIDYCSFNSLLFTKLPSGRFAYNFCPNFSESWIFPFLIVCLSHFKRSRFDRVSLTVFVSLPLKALLDAFKILKIV